MPIVKKTFVGGINQDDADFLVQPTEYLGGLNIRFVTTENGEVGNITNIEGTQEKNQTKNSAGATVTWSLPAGVNRTIGAFEDTAKRRLFWFNWNSNGNHGIYCYDNDDNIIYTVFYQSGLSDVLNFQESSFVHSVSMAGNLLYWTDNYNEPKRINVEAAIKMNHPTYSTTEAKYDAFSIKRTAGGSGYVNGTYTNVPLTGGSGTGALATMVVIGTVVDSVTITYHGTGYAAGDTLSASNTNLGGTGSGLSILVTKIFDKTVVSLIRPQPMLPLNVLKVIDGSFSNNFIQSESFQFAYRFVYRDNEVSTFSPLSKLVDYNTDLENTAGYNAVQITIQSGQWIEQDVKKIEFAAKFITGGKMFVFKTLETGFQSHNSGSNISFNFYNDVIGVSVDDASAVKQFDQVPIKSKALEIAKNRLFLGNNTDGYDTPTSTSLTIGSSVVSTTSVVGKWFVLVYNAPGGPFTKFLLFVDNITGNNGYYEKNVSFSPPPWPTTANLPADYTWKGYTLNEIAASYGVLPSAITLLQDSGNTATVSGVTLAGLNGKVVFKSDTSYRAGIVFFDYAGRKSGVITSDSIKVNTPDREYSGASFTEKFSWSLNNTGAVTEIPSWATHYSIVRTKSLRTNFFAQQIADSVKYITKDATGAYQTPTTTYAANSFGVAIQVTSLSSIGFGYTYQEGDIVKLYLSGGATYKLRVKDTYSDYIITELANVGSGPTALYEVYSPFIQSDTLYYYEVGETYAVTNPGTVSRQYGTVSGFFTGDVTLLERTVGANTKWTENMSPNDKYWKNWYTDAGRVNITISEGQNIKPVTIAYSATVVPGTKVNGLSTFEALDQTSLPTELVGISRLIFTSKSITDGTVMIAVGEQETASVYLGESQILDNTGSSFLAKSTGVIGNVNVLKGSYGTIHPESAFEWQGAVCFFDSNKGCWVRYDLNGLTPISDNKMSKYFRKVGTDILNYFVSGTEYGNLNPNLSLRVLGAIDPYHGEFIMSMPRMKLAPQNEVLSDMQIGTITTAITTTPPTNTYTINVVPDKVYTISAPAGVDVFYLSTKIWGTGANNTFVATDSTSFVVESASPVSGNIVLTEILSNTYDAYDGIGGTWCYHPAIDRFTGKYSFRPEWFSMVGNRLVSFKNGKPYIHNGTYNTFYGQAYDTTVASIHGDAERAVNIYNALAVEGDIPSRMHFRTEVPYVQSSDLVSNDFVLREGTGYSDILRDRLSPNTTGTFDEKVYKGDRVRGDSCRFIYLLTQPTTKKSLSFINLVYTPSTGQSI